MITKNRFTEIKNEVENMICDTFNELIRSNIKNFILFIANAEYIKHLVNSNFSPYVIDYVLDSHNDSHRQKFLMDFLNTYYSFAKKVELEDDVTRFTIELMIYTHIWESKPYLKNLYRLASIINKGNYEWDCDVPDNPKQPFIKEKIRDVFDKKDNPIADIISKGYNSSLRNAFAHSEYTFVDSEIKLLNYKNKDKSWALQKITFDDWNERFAYSFLLCYYLDKYHYSRKEILKAIGQYTFEIKYPDNKNVIVQYNQENNSFYHNVKV